MPDPHSSKNRPASQSRRWFAATAVVASVVLAAGLLVWYKDTRKFSSSLAPAPSRGVPVDLTMRVITSLNREPTLGRHTYRTHCAHCHEPAMDVSLGPPLLDDTTPCRSDDWMFRMISRGGQSIEGRTETVDRDMHEFENILTHDEIRATILYIRSQKHLNNAANCRGRKLIPWHDDE